MIPLSFGYMNPGAGSLLLQLILMGTAGAVLGARSVWHAVRSLWTRKR